MDEEKLEKQLYRFMTICMWVLGSALILSIAVLLVYVVGSILEIF